MEKLIKEANEQGKDFSFAEMRAAGLRDNEISAMRDWRRFWDTAWHLENRDAAKTLMQRGYQEFIDEVGDTRLFAKPLSSTQVNKVGTVYDPVTDKIVRISSQEMKELYEKQGTVAQMLQPMIRGDDVVDFLVVRNAPSENYLRAVTPDTTVLNYRKGYYAVKYKHPYFIIEKVKNSRGEVVKERAVATAGSRKDAEAFAHSKASNSGKVFNDDYYVRGDLKSAGISSGDYWDLQQVSGRSAQRIRSKRLEDVDTNISDPSQSNILDPVDSMIAAARSVAARTSMRDVLETTKARFVDQYKEFLPTGDFGTKILPNNPHEIVYRGGQAENGKKLADARTTYEYIRYLEDGYINHIDDSYKAILKSLSDMAGDRGLAGTDAALKWMSEGRGQQPWLRTKRSLHTWHFIHYVSL